MGRRVRLSGGGKASLCRLGGCEVRGRPSRPFFRQLRDLRLEARDFPIEPLGRLAAAKEGGERHHKG